MVVSGVPEDREDHALRLGCFAIEMRDALLKYNKEKKLKYPLVSTSVGVLTPHANVFERNIF